MCVFSFFAPKCFLLPPILSSQNSPTACQSPWCCSSGPLSRVAFLPGLRRTGFYLLSSSPGLFFYLDLPLTPSSEPFQQLQFRLPLRFLAFLLIFMFYICLIFLTFPMYCFAFWEHMSVCCFRVIFWTGEMVRHLRTLAEGLLVSSTHSRWLIIRWLGLASGSTPTYVAYTFQTHMKMNL